MNRLGDWFLGVDWLRVAAWAAGMAVLLKISVIFMVAWNLMVMR